MTTLSSAVPPSSSRPAGGCTGDGCSSREPWPLHHVRHRGVYCRLCTSCVLKYHPSLFCSLCLDLLSDSISINGDRSSSSSRSLINCSSSGCQHVSHATCVPSPSSEFFLCPSCNTNRDAAGGGTARHTIDKEYAKELLCAARLAAASMSRAAAAARSEAERKVREASLARKRAREMLERVSNVKREGEERERERKERVKGLISSNKTQAVKSVGVSGREREKWMRFHEMNNNNNNNTTNTNTTTTNNNNNNNNSNSNNNKGGGEDNKEGIGGLERKVTPVVDSTLKAVDKDKQIMSQMIQDAPVTGNNTSAAVNKGSLHA